MSKVSIVDAKKELKEDIRKAVALIGDFSRFIKKGDTVLVKPNYNSPDAPPASTDIAFLKAVVELIYEAGAKEVTIGESSGMLWFPSRRVLKKAGVFDLSKDIKAKLVCYDDGKFVKRIFPPEAKYLESIHITEETEKHDKIILVPCMKTHMISRFTMSLKLAVGMISRPDRYKMHLSHIEEKCAEINLLYKPDLIIMDGRKAFATSGPSFGKVVEPRVILASTDRVALDIEGVKILQSYKEKNRLDMPVLELPLIKHAIEIGIGKPGAVVRG